MDSVMKGLWGHALPQSFWARTAPVLGGFWGDRHLRATAVSSLDVFYFV